MRHEATIAVARWPCQGGQSKGGASRRQLRILVTCATASCRAPTHLVRAGKVDGAKVRREAVRAKAKLVAAFAHEAGAQGRAAGAALFHQPALPVNLLLRRRRGVAVEARPGNGHKVRLEQLPRAGRDKVLRPLGARAAHARLDYLHIMEREEGESSGIGWRVSWLGAQLLEHSGAVSRGRTSSSGVLRIQAPSDWSMAALGGGCDLRSARISAAASAAVFSAALSA